MKKFRMIRQIISSVVCVVLAFIVVHFGYVGSTIDKVFLKILLIVLGAGVLYGVFGLSGLVLEAVSKNGFIKNNRVWNYVLDTAIYLGLCVGAFFLVTFICNKVVWIGLILAIGGAIEIYRDIRYMIEAVDQKVANAEGSAGNPN